MSDAYDTQAPKIANKQEAKHKALYEQADKEFDKLYKWKPPAVQNQKPSTSSPRIVEDLKPTAMLLASMSLKAYRHWESQYKVFVKHNMKAFEAASLEIQKAYLDKSMDPKLAKRFKTLQLANGTLEIKETTIIEETIKALERMFWCRCMDYFNLVQGTGENLRDWWHAS